MSLATIRPLYQYVRLRFRSRGQQSPVKPVLADSYRLTGESEGPMVTLDELKIPRAARPYAEQVVAVTDAVCLEHLDAEYADLFRRPAETRTQTSIASDAGDPRIWGAGVVYAIGQLNFLFDKSQPVHLTADQLGDAVDVKKTTMSNKAQLIRDLLNLSHFDTEFSRRELIERSPLTWMLQVDGLIVDARQLPRALQVEACEMGLIPHVPGGKARED